MLLALSVLMLASHVSSQFSSIYVPGNVDDTPGASLSSIGSGSYVIEGQTLVEDGDGNVALTQIDSNGETVFNCVIGDDAQATCSVSQQYNGVQYTYIEPVTYFGGQVATPSGAASQPLTRAGGAQATAASSSGSYGWLNGNAQAAATATPSTNTAKPSAGMPQQTMSNIFVDNVQQAASSTGGAKEALKIKGGVVGMIVAAAVIVGGVLL